MRQRARERARAGLLAALIAATWWLADIGSASASHGWTTVAVREVHAYRHVLALNDRLVLGRYALTEQPGDDEKAYGPGGAILKVQDGSDVLGQSHPPATGYGLVAFYWGPNDANTEVPWGDSDVQLCIHGSPTLFDPPQSHCDTPANDPDWNATSDLPATADELADDIKDVVLALEADDPDIASQEYVSPSGITIAGRAKVDAAFPHIAFIASGAFEISQGPATGDFTHTTSTIPDPTALTVDGSDSAFSIDLANLGNSFGIPFLAMGIGLVAAMAVCMYAAIAYSRGDSQALLLYPFQVILMGGMIGVPPFMAAIGILVLACTVSFATIVNRFWPS